MYLSPKYRPPTCDAARYHSYRVYHQVQTLLSNDHDSNIQLQKDQNAERLKQVKIRRDPAPASMLTLVKCHCHSKFDKNSCSCNKDGLLCSLACGHCKRINCNNTAVNNEAVHFPAVTPIDRLNLLQVSLSPNISGFSYLNDKY